MWLSDTSVKRPVMASVLSLLLVAFGLVAFDRLPLREYPDIDPPIVSIDTNYRGASAEVVESRVTQIIEDRIAGIEGIKYIASVSRDGRSVIDIEFNISRDIDAAANDVRDRVSGVLDNLPDEADPPEVQKVDADGQVILWLNLVSDRHSVLELTDYADRYIVDRLSSLDGVARIMLSGGKRYAMRIWLDRDAMAARGVVVSDVEAALQAENVELPAGSLQSLERDFTVRTERGYTSAREFGEMVVRMGADGYPLRLRDIARVELGADEERQLFRGNGVPMIGVGIIKTSKASAIAVSQLVREERAKIDTQLPAGMSLKQSYDSSVFVENAIHEVWVTLGIAGLLVVLVMYAFLGDLRATLIPSLTLPVCVLATGVGLLMFDYSLNLLTLLALVLTIGLVVDDAIVVLENIHRHQQMGASPLVAAYRGTREVGFAVVATTLVLVAVFLPIAFSPGQTGRLFAEFAVTMAVAVALSGLVALTLTPALAGQWLRPDAHAGASRFTQKIDSAFLSLRAAYQRGLRRVLDRPRLVLAVLAGIIVLTVLMFRGMPQDLAPREDRGAFFVTIIAPEGAGFEYTSRYIDEIERRLMPLVESGDLERLLLRAPMGQLGNEFNRGSAVLVMSHWNEGRRSAWEIMDDVRARLKDLSGVQAFPVMSQPLGAGGRKPVQFVLGGSNYAELANWRDIMLKAAAENPGLQGVDHDYRETKPQIRVRIDRDRAADLGVSVTSIGRTLETLLGARQITTFVRDGEEYDVLLEAPAVDKRTPHDIGNIHVRAERTGALVPLSSLVTLEEYADSGTRNRFNRMRSITLEATLAGDYSLGEALLFLEQKAQELLPGEVRIDYRGTSSQYQESSNAFLLTFVLALLVVYLVLAGQFESFVHPFVIMFTVPLATAGALLGLYFTGQSLNIYSQIGAVMLVGLATKNGILIVEFANQLRDQGMAFRDAIVEASSLRLRPIIMTSLATVMGAVPLALAYGAGSEARQVIGVVLVFGVTLATVLTLFVIPVLYELLARNTKPLGAVARRLSQEAGESP